MLAPFPLINTHFLTFLLSINIGVVAISLVFIIYLILENYQALLWWIFQMGKFLQEKATLIKSEILK